MSDFQTGELGALSTWTAESKHFVEGELASQFVGMSANVTEPGNSSPFWHTHSVVEEVYVFLEGNGEMALDDEVVSVSAGSVVRVGQNVWRALHCLADSATPLKWLCVRAGGRALSEIGKDADLDRERAFPWG